MTNVLNTVHRKYDLEKKNGHNNHYTRLYACHSKILKKIKSTVRITTLMT